MFRNTGESHETVTETYCENSRVTYSPWFWTFLLPFEITKIKPREILSYQNREIKNQLGTHTEFHVTL